MIEILIGNKSYSSWSFRAWILLKKSGLPFLEKNILLNTPGYKEKILEFSPSGQVPAIKDGDLLIWDSLAIADYITKKVPEMNLWPKDEKAHFWAKSICCEMHAGFSNLRDSLSSNFRHKKKNVTLNDATKQDIARIIDIWQPLLKNSQTWLFGDFSVADAFFIPVAIARFYAYGIEMPAIVNRYIEFLLSDADVKLWLTEAKRESEVISADEVGEKAGYLI